MQKYLGIVVDMSLTISDASILGVPRLIVKLLLKIASGISHIF